MYGKSTSAQTTNLSLTVYNNIALINETRDLPRYKSDSNPYVSIEYFDISKYIDETSVIITGMDDFIMIFNYLCCNVSPYLVSFFSVLVLSLLSFIIIS